jgi:hypothetical protein
MEVAWDPRTIKSERFLEEGDCFGSVRETVASRFRFRREYFPVLRENEVVENMINCIHSDMFEESKDFGTTQLKRLVQTPWL